MSGQLMVFWLREENGEDVFAYYPFYGDPLTYTLPRSLQQKLQVKSIRPGAIYTDGGSIPRAVRGVAGFSPWGYAPAYIVHDWLFVARHCIKAGLEDKHDERDRREVDTVRRVDFPMSADILGAVISSLEHQHLVSSHPLAPRAIYGAVESGIARSLWDSPDPARCRPMAPEDVKKINDAIHARKQPLTLLAAPDSNAPRLVFVQRY